MPALPVIEVSQLPSQPNARTRVGAPAFARTTDRIRHLWQVIAREPLVHFLAVGVAIFVIANLKAADPQRHRIVVDDQLVARLGTNYAQQYGSAPTSEQLAFVVDQHVRQEILYREGLALGLDVDDEIIRRRVAQKFQFLQQDLAVASEPTDVDMHSFYDSHRDKYTVPEKVSFSHVYFSPDRGGEQAAQSRAARTLELLRHQAVTRAPERGDRFADLYDYASFGPTELQRLFGDAPLAQQLLNAPVGQWAGPFRSGFGWHLVFVNHRQAAYTPPFDAVREQVQEDSLLGTREADNAAAFAKLASQYTIVHANGKRR
jgi:hypothetical protein